ncbi:MAG: SAM-dependent methyltransferase [Gammaproteobacteria bacterium]|jgi:SAM-dependent methyltransferase
MKGKQPLARRIDDTAPAHYDAELYAKLHRGTPGDVAFYMEATRGAEDVLELGCGYGRILIELIRAGHHVTGLDTDPGMLALVRAAGESLTAGQNARIALAHGDMRDFQLKAQFDRVIIPYNGLYCLLSEAAVTDCLRCAAAHLRDTGQVVFDAYAIDDFHTDMDPDEFNSALDGHQDSHGHGDSDDDDDDEAIESIDWQDRTYDVFETCRWNKPGQQLEVTYSHVPRDGSDSIVKAISHRYLLTSQIEHICKQAGLQIVDLHQDFAGTALGFEAEHIVCVATKA